MLQNAEIIQGYLFFSGMITLGIAGRDGTPVIPRPLTGANRACSLSLFRAGGLLWGSRGWLGSWRLFLLRHFPVWPG